MGGFAVRLWRMARRQAVVNRPGEDRVRMINALGVLAAPFTASSPAILMVSGGSDSTALLVRAVRGLLDLGEGPQRLDPACLHVLHVNHCLRGEASDGDEVFVRDLCASLGVPCSVERVDVGALAAAGQNLEEAARQVRYRAAWELARRLARERGTEPRSARVLVAHTADDRAETFLMRALTGAGMAGLTGLRFQRGIVVRPLLDETRTSLRAYLGEQGIGWREDATNAEDDALRSYVRNRVVPPLVARNPSFSRTLGRSLDVLAEEDDLLERLAAQALATARVSEPGEALVLDAGALAAGEVALMRRAVRQALREFLGEERFVRGRFEGRHIEAVLEVARAGRGSRTLPLALDVRADHGKVVVTDAGKAAGRVAALPQVLEVPGVVAWQGGYLRASLVGVPSGSDPCEFARDRALGRAVDEGLREGRDFVLADAHALGLDREGTGLEVGAPVPGEAMKPFGLGFSKAVADVLADARVPLRRRPLVPVVRTTWEGYRAQDGSGVVWVGGIRLDARAAYGPQTRVLVELTFWTPAGPEACEGASTCASKPAR